jgi:hypothetical protein
MFVVKVGVSSFPSVLDAVLWRFGLHGFFSVRVSRHHSTLANLSHYYYSDIALYLWLSKLLVFPLLLSLFGFARGGMHDDMCSNVIVVV